MGNNLNLPTYTHDNKSYEELLHELCMMYKHTAEVYHDPASYYKLGTAVTVSWYDDDTPPSIVLSYTLLTDSFSLFLPLPPSLSIYLSLYLSIGQLFTGSCYQYGRGADINMLKAIAHYDTAARMGYSKAQYHLGDLLYQSYHINWLHKLAKYNVKVHV
jgi:TPR repeat protein